MCGPRDQPFVKALAGGPEGKYVFFFGGTKGLPNSYLSNWYPSEFEVNDVKYNCVEQFMMACKANVFDDQENLQKVMIATNPGAQKRLGKQVLGFSDEVWDVHKERVVFQGCMAKFEQNPDLLEKLINTSGKTLVEASPYDRIWGIGMGENDPNRFDENKWGQNLLGKALMKVRENIGE